MSAIISVASKPMVSSFWREGSVAASQTNNSMNGWNVSSTYELVHSIPYQIIGLHYCFDSAISAGSLTFNYRVDGATATTSVVNSSSARAGTVAAAVPQTIAVGERFEITWDSDGSLAGPSHFVAQPIIRML